MTLEKALQDAEYWHSTAMRLTNELDEAVNTVEAVLTELNNIDDYAARLEKYGEEDKAEGLFEASARIRNTMQKVLDCPPEKEGE